MKKILIIDDDHDLLELMGIYLSKKGFQTKTSEKANEVFELASSFTPDLIVMDVLLGGYDGRLICQQLKNTPEFAHIPILMISAHPKAEELIQKYQCNAFLAKPFNVKGLSSSIGELLHTSE